MCNGDEGVTTDNVAVNTSVAAASMRSGAGDRSSSLPEWGRAGAVVLLAGRGCCKPVAASSAWLQATSENHRQPRSPLYMRGREDEDDACAFF
jgi:hypothetical protein